MNSERTGSAVETEPVRRADEGLRAPSAFSLATTPLPTGPTLLEASAGTGKTYALAGLFLRLLLQHGLSHREILIVTYTEAATEELRERIRRRLAEALVAFTIGHSDDALLAELLRVQSPEAEPDVSREPTLGIGLQASDLAHSCATLTRALSDFDETPIYTLHGFCQRVLRDRAFESGGLFDLELVTDPGPMLDELVADWWRNTFATPAEITTLAPAGFALAVGLSPESLRRFLNETLRHPGLRTLASVTAADLPALLKRLDEKFGEAARAFAASRAELRGLFGANAEWATKDFAKDAPMDAAFASFAACFNGTAGAEDFTVFADFTPAQLTAHTNKARKKNPHRPPAHPFFAHCGDLVALQGSLHAAWLLAFHDWTGSELPRRKRDRKVQAFEDLLTRLDNVLAGPGGDALAAALTRQYAAALIDEFQDTDPVQWRIFRRLFGGSDQRLFLIGDPKQAIYGFRGADVFTYLTAASSAPHRHTLDTNWRSESGLVAAVNGIFGAHPHPFVVSEIRFAPVIASGRADDAPLTEDGRKLAPLQLWFCTDEEPLTKTKAEPALAEMAATEIVRLLTPASRIRLGDTPLQTADLAVLVESHQQAELVARALRRRGVPSVQRTQAGVFASDEAAQLTTLLAAIAEPANDRRLRAALATDILGLDAPKLEELAADEAALAAWRERFAGWLARWNAAGFLPMFRELLQTRHLRRRWLTDPDGERRLTNLLHLAALLHTAATERRLGVNGLRQHLGHRRAHSDEAGDEELLRLERDDQAVQLVTIHRSKGLEYPVVFCPFTFRIAESNQRRGSGELVLCHDPADRATMLGDLGSPQLADHKLRAAEERLAENVRLLYVALTRARHRCYFAWGDFKDRNTTAPAWLFTPPSALAQGVRRVEALQAAGAVQTAEEKHGAVAHLAATVPSIAVVPPPEATPASWTPPADQLTPLAPREFTVTIPRDWRVASFSWLTAGRWTEAPDYDASPAPPSVAAVQPESGSIHAFPRGTEAGTCLHKIFERIDFTTALTDEAALGKIISGALREHAPDARTFAPAVADMVRRTLGVSLDASRSTPALTLNQVPVHARLNELEFCFPLRRFASADLRRVLARHPAHLPAGFPDALERLRFDPVKGVLRGFMDLVFQHDGRWWLVDWKSNWLGPRTEDYTPRALAAEMAAHFYPLQYLLYTLALDRWLALRVPGYDYARDFGGVRYLFLRGLNPSRPELGVFADKPSAALIRDLGELLLAPAEGGGE